MRPKVKPEFRDFLPQRTEEERKLLRQSIIDDGIRDPIVITSEGYIVDGYGRWEIAQELKLKIKTFVKEFKDDAEVFEWMASNQLARRNLTDEERSYFRGKKYTAKKQSEPFRDASVGNDYPPGERISEIVAAETGVSEKTIRLDEQFARGVDALPPEVKAEVLAGKSDLTKKEIIAIAPIMCDRCRRHGVPAKNCEKCEVAQSAHKKKKLGPKPKKAKAGSMRFDWAKAESEMGVVVRHSDRVADGYELPKNTGKHQKAQDLINTYVDFMKEWKKELTKS